MMMTLQATAPSLGAPFMPSVAMSECLVARCDIASRLKMVSSHDRYAAVTAKLQHALPLRCALYDAQIFDGVPRSAFAQYTIFV